MTDTDALTTLRQEIAEGWKVKITDHDYLNDSRDDVTVESIIDGDLILRAKRPWSSQGRSFPHMSFPWTGDLEVDGRTVACTTRRPRTPASPAA